MIVLAILLAGCGEAPQPPAAPPPPNVTVAKPTKRTIVEQDEYVGRFVAVDMVEVRARVSGYLDKVHFQDGQTRQSRATCCSPSTSGRSRTRSTRRAPISRPRAPISTFTEADLARGRQLLRDRTISEQVFEQRAQAYRNARGLGRRQRGARCARPSSISNLPSSSAPIGGRIGDRRVTPGNLVTGGTGGYHYAARHHRLDRSDPPGIHLRRGLALRYERLARDGSDGTRRGKTPVRLQLIDEQDFSHHGRMDFVDNVIDRATGTIRGRAQFANADGLFTPGMFARVQMPGSAPYQALLVPDAAIGTEQARKFVLVVNADDVVAQKYVTLGEVVDGLRVIKSGISQPMIGSSSPA